MTRPTHLNHLNHLNDLALLIERLRDAELVRDAEAATLLTATQAARRSLEAGDVPAARRHVARVVRLAEDVMTARSLAPADGRALLDTARRVLEGEAGAGQTD